MIKKFMNVKIRNLFQILSSFWKDVSTRDYSNFDPFQISQLELLSTNIFFFYEDIEIGEKQNELNYNNHRIETKNESIKDVINLLKSDKDYNQLNDNEKKEFRKILPEIHKQTNQLNAEKTELQKLQGQLMGLKAIVTTSGGKSFDENFYHRIDSSIKDAFEYVYLYLKNPHNINSYKTNYFIPEQKRVIMNNGKQALQSVVNETKQMRSSVENNTVDVPLLNDPTKVSNIAKYLISQIHNRSPVKI